MTNVINVEIYSLLFSIIILLDYYDRFKYKITRVSNQFLRLLSYIISIAVLNIALTLLQNNDVIRYYVFVLTFVVAYLPPIVLYEYVEENYLMSKYYLQNKIYIKALYLVCVVLCLAYAFYAVPNYEMIPSYIASSAYYNIILLFSVIPILVLFLEYVINLLFKHKKGNNRIFFTITFCLVGIATELVTANYYFFTLTYMISAFLLYSYRYDIMVNKDILTGLYNREIINKLEHDKRLSSRIVALYMIDVDKFKIINDTYGHEKGDLVLQDVARLLVESVRHNDYVIRYGGDEFVIIADLNKSDDKDVIIDKINGNLKKYNRLNAIPISLSIGSSILTRDKQGKYDIYKVLKQADTKMYKIKQAKKAKKN